MPTIFWSKVIIRTFLHSSRPQVKRIIFVEVHSRAKTCNTKYNRFTQTTPCGFSCKRKASEKRLATGANQDQAQKWSFLGIVKLPHQQQFWRALEASTLSISFNLLVKFHPIKPHPGEEPNRSSIGCWCCHSAYCIVLYSYRGSGRIHTYYYNDY